MGARGNSGVITSQILRGLCEGSVGWEELTSSSLAKAFEKAVEVAFQAVRKPVEGTILTVLRDSAQAAVNAVQAGAAHRGGPRGHRERGLRLGCSALPTCCPSSRRTAWWTPAASAWPSSSTPS